MHSSLEFLTHRPFAPAVCPRQWYYDGFKGSYRDLSNTNDTGGRILEFSLRFNF